jgi:hypothetical protein
VRASDTAAVDGLFASAEARYRHFGAILVMTHLSTVLGGIAVLPASQLQSSRTTREQADVDRFATQYWGPLPRVGSFLSFSINYYLNGRSFMERGLERAA